MCIRTRDPLVQVSDGSRAGLRVTHATLLLTSAPYWEVLLLH